MNPDNPNEILARAQFQGDDLRLLDYLISETEYNLRSLQTAIGSFVLDKSQNLDNFEPTTDKADSAMALNQNSASYLELLKSEVQRCTRELEELKTRRQNLIKERSSPDRLQ